MQDLASSPSCLDLLSPKQNYSAQTSLLHVSLCFHGAISINAIQGTHEPGVNVITMFESGSESLLCTYKKTVSIHSQAFKSGVYSTIMTLYLGLESEQGVGPLQWEYNNVY